MIKSYDSHPDGRTSLARRPLIGLTGRRLASSQVSSLEERYRHTHINMYFSDFAQQVGAAGGLSVEIPYVSASAELIEHVDGLVVTGGQDVVPSRWGGDEVVARGPVDPERDDYESTLIEAALAAGKPVLGICRGMQLLNVVLGGTLVGDLSAVLLDHTSGSRPVGERHHDVSLVKGSLAHSLYGDSTAVNSLHHQAVDRCGEGLLVSGRAADGVVEVIELPGQPVLGVQWHPEWMPEADPVFRWFVNAAIDCAHGCYSG